MRNFLLFPLSGPLRRLATVLLLPLLAACSTGSSDAESEANALNKDKINTADVTAKQEADARFLVKATSNALLEVELGKLAQARAGAPAVRELGTRLVQSRLELLTALRTLAETKQLAVPSALGGDEQAAYHEASTQAGSELDKHVVALLVKTQKQDANAFDDTSDDAYDDDIRGFAAKHLRAVEELLANTKTVADKLP